MTITGGCRCGACRYEIWLDDLPPIYCCHCLDCQTWSGSAFSMQGVIAEGALTSGGPVVEYRLVTPSGALSTQRVCATCHTRLWNTNSARRGVAVIRAGTLDHSAELRPRLHMWVERKQPWVAIGDVPAYDETPPAAEFARLLG